MFIGAFIRAFMVVEAFFAGVPRIALPAIYPVLLA